MAPELTCTYVHDEHGYRVEADCTHNAQIGFYTKNGVCPHGWALRDHSTLPSKRFVLSKMQSLPATVRAYVPDGHGGWSELQCTPTQKAVK